MGYYHIKLHDNVDAQNLCTIVSPLQMRKYKYKHLPVAIKIGWILMFSKCHF
jgi:hypothetical protein